jgi:hypothetical protein
MGTECAIKRRPVRERCAHSDAGEEEMASATQLGTAGLQGWRRKVGDAVAGPLAQRTPLATEQIKALVGALFFALSVMYVVKTLTAAAHELRGS